ncbi:hypothetical protein PHYPSEUDO_013482 [Phytophthora pseudosyringae]|uniref:Uncharacterized protein n=1 Tax=Phytophthora pseudosyringae TaxID=221518 RepID=A0A8T1WKQ4_9STRA|nr:hypothetical protein PHYPSEUDO_013482 [Phytophthora pseudosyringae]
MNSPVPAWTRERHGRMEAARSLLRSSPAPSPVRSAPQQSTRRRELLNLSGHSSGGSAADTATWASPSAARARARPSNLHAAVRASPSFALSRRDAAAPLRTPVERVSRAPVQSRTTQATQTDPDAELKGLRPDAVVHLGAFGEVGAMTVETVDFLIRVLEDVGAPVNAVERKQELLVSGEDRLIHVKASYAVAEDGDDASEETQRATTSKVARLQLDSTNNGGVGVTELVRSHSYEALVQLEGILEARHNRLMSDGLLETADATS